MLYAYNVPDRPNQKFDKASFNFYAILSQVDPIHIEGSGVAVFCVGQHKQFPDHCQLQFVTEILWPKNNDVCVFRSINIAKTSNGGGCRRGVKKNVILCSKHEYIVYTLSRSLDQMNE